MSIVNGVASMLGTTDVAPLPAVAPLPTEIAPNDEEDIEVRTFLSQHAKLVKPSVKEDTYKTYNDNKTAYAALPTGLRVTIMVILAIVFLCIVPYFAVYSVKAVRCRFKETASIAIIAGVAYFTWNKWVKYI